MGEPGRGARGMGEVLRVLAELRGTYDGGEAVDELSHALQCATLAAEAGAPAELVAAALLHDVGRHPAIAGSGRATPHQIAGSGRATPHEIAGARWLRPRFGQKVAWLVMAHVPAKVYLVRDDPTYLSSLSAVSAASLAHQTGHHPALGRLAVHPFWEDALQVRRWDDAAKVPGAPEMGLDEAVGRIAHLVVRC